MGCGVTAHPHRRSQPRACGRSIAVLPTPRRSVSLHATRGHLVNNMLMLAAVVGPSHVEASAAHVVIQPDLNLVLCAAAQRDAPSAVWDCLGFYTMDWSAGSDAQWDAAWIVQPVRARCKGSCLRHHGAGQKCQSC